MALFNKKEQKKKEERQAEWQQTCFAVLYNLNRKQRGTKPLQLTINILCKRNRIIRYDEICFELN